jgi:hypothetical protein
MMNKLTLFLYYRFYIFISIDDKVKNGTNLNIAIYILE